MKFLKLFLLILACFYFYSCASKKEVSESKLNYKFEKIEYRFEDPSLQNKFKNIEKKTEFTQGQNFDYLTFIRERIRITELMRKRVDPDFSGEKVQFEIDTTLADNKFSVLTIIEK